MCDTDRITPSLQDFDVQEFEPLWEMLQEFEASQNEHPDPFFEQLGYNIQH